MSKYLTLVYLSDSLFLLLSLSLCLSLSLFGLKLWEMPNAKIVFQFLFYSTVHKSKH